MKKLLSIFLVVSMLLSLCAITVVAATPDGSEANPYLASTKDELVAAVSKITAGSTNNHIKLTSDITVTDYWSIGSNSKEIVLDMDGHTITSNNSVDFSCGTLKNGIITSDSNGAFRVNGNNLDSTVYLENLEIISTNTNSYAYAMRIMDVDIVMNNCKIIASCGTGINMLARSNESETSDPPAVEYTATLTNVDITATTYACELMNQMEEVNDYSYEEPPMIFYVPHAYYTFSLNGESVSDVNSPESVKKSGNIVGGYDDSWKPKRGNLSVTYTIAEPTYTVTIPATAELDTEFNITAENVANVHSTQRVTVKVTDWTKADVGEGFALSNGDAYIPCNVTAGNGGAAIALGDAVLSVNSDGSAPMYITLTYPDSLYAPGTYNGTMNFTIEITFESTQLLGAGTESNPYIVSSEAELSEAVAKTDSEKNYIKVRQDFDIESSIIAEHPMVLDLDGNTVSFIGEYSGFDLRAPSTIKNGSVTAINTAIGNSITDVILSNLTVTSTENSGVKLFGGTSVIVDCDITGKYFGLRADWGAHIVNDVTLTGEDDGAYEYNTVSSSMDSVAFVLDGVNIALGTVCSETTYKTPGRP